MSKTNFEEEAETLAKNFNYYLNMIKGNIFSFRNRLDNTEYVSLVKKVDQIIAVLSSCHIDMTFKLNEIDTFLSIINQIQFRYNKLSSKTSELFDIIIIDLVGESDFEKITKDLFCAIGISTVMLNFVNSARNLVSDMVISRNNELSVEKLFESIDCVDINSESCENYCKGNGTVH